MFKNVAAKFIVFAFDATSNVPKTGDAANITAYVSKDYGAVTVLGDTSATEMDATNAPGYYLFDAAQAETNADCLMVSGKSSTANIKVIGAPAVIYTRPTTGWLAPATAGRTLVVDAAGLADANTVKVGPTGAGTAQTALDIGGNYTAARAAKIDNLSGDAFARLGAPAGASIAADVAAVKSDTGTILTDVNGGAGAIYTRLGAPAGASLAADIAAVNAKTTNLPAAPASTTNITAGTIAAVTGVVSADIKKVNGVTVNGDGAGTPWGP
jgi:hypothetical protein